MSLKPLVLSEEEKEHLGEIIRKGRDWRMRERAETILRLSFGEAAKVIAEVQGICREAVYDRRRKWIKEGIAGLADAFRSGAPDKLEKYETVIGEWVRAEPLCVSEVHRRLEEEFDVKVHPNTVKNVLKRLGFVWKRTRYSLKKKETRSLSRRPGKTSPG
jgi:transposase